MRVEFRIPISPTPAFFSQVRLIALSLKRLGPPYSQATIRILAGDHASATEMIARNAWARDYPVQWHAVPNDVCDRLGLAAAGLSRYESPAESDVVILCDADTCPVARFDELLDRMAAAPMPSVAGLQAHYSPFHPPVNNSDGWGKLLNTIGQPVSLCDRPYSLDVFHEHGLAPAYFNYGFVAFSAEAFRMIAPVFEHYAALAMDIMPGSPYFAQAGLSLAMIVKKVGIIHLSHEYNCANDDHLIDRGLVRLDDIKIIHYLRTLEFDRHCFLCQRDKYEYFIKTEKKNPVSEQLRQHILSIPDIFVEWA